MSEAVGSETARTLSCALQTEPTPASYLAEAVETSLQNVQYRLDRPCEVGLVEPVDASVTVAPERAVRPVEQLP